MSRLACVLTVCAVVAVPTGLQAQASMRARYDAAQAAGPGGSGQWYRDRTNENGLLSWGTSYAMMSFLVMYEATGEAQYLERLAYVADGVLSRRLVGKTLVMSTRGAASVPALKPYLRRRAKRKEKP